MARCRVLNPTRTHPIWKQIIGGDAEGKPPRLELHLCPRQPPLLRLRSDQEGAGDLLGGQPAERTERQRHLGLGGQPGVWMRRSCRTTVRLPRGSVTAGCQKRRPGRRGGAPRPGRLLRPPRPDPVAVFGHLPSVHEPCATVADAGARMIVSNPLFDYAEQTKRLATESPSGSAFRWLETDQAMLTTWFRRRYRAWTDMTGCCASMARRLL
jgi:hypothetical protein